MTTELVHKLIAHYEMVVGKVREAKDVTEAHEITVATYTKHGVCYCSDHRFGHDIYDNQWGVNNSNINWVWGRKPSDCTTIPQILTALQLRIDILKTFPALKASI